MLINSGRVHWIVLPGCNYGNSRAHLPETEHTQISLEPLVLQSFPKFCGKSQMLLTIFQQKKKKKSSLMPSTACRAWIFPLLYPQIFQWKTAGSCASPDVTDGTGINFCSGFIAKVSRKRPVLFRGLRGHIDFLFFFGQVLLKCTFWLSKFWNSTEMQSTMSCHLLSAELCPIFILLNWLKTFQFKS